MVWSQHTVRGGLELMSTLVLRRAGGFGGFSDAKNRPMIRFGRSGARTHAMYAQATDRAAPRESRARKDTMTTITSYGDMHGQIEEQSPTDAQSTRNEAEHTDCGMVRPPPTPMLQQPGRGSRSSTIPHAGDPTVCCPAVNAALRPKGHKAPSSIRDAANRPAATSMSSHPRIWLVGQLQGHWMAEAPYWMLSTVTRAEPRPIGPSSDEIP